MSEASRDVFEKLMMCAGLDFTRDGEIYPETKGEYRDKFVASAWRYWLELDSFKTGGWQEIRTAPTATPILLYAPATALVESGGKGFAIRSPEFISIGWWRTGDGYPQDWVMLDSMGLRYARPTHWMPLPTRPAQGSEVRSIGAPCPFCGAAQAMYDAGHVCCNTPDCALFKRMIPEEKWNNRKNQTA